MSQTFKLTDLVSWDNTILSRIWKKSLFYMLFSVFWIYIDFFLDNHPVYENIGLPAVETALVPLSIFGIAISFIIQFRNNNAYQRFHEGRELWGKIVNDARNFSMVVRTNIRYREGEKTEVELEQIKTALIRNMVSCIFFIKHQLRDYAHDRAQAIPYIDDLPIKILTLEHKANAIILSMHHQLSILHDQGYINDFNYVSIIDVLQRMTNHYGGCERIKNTPVPPAYTILTYRLIHIYLVWMAVGLVSLNYLAALIVMPIATYIFFGFADIGREIMNPFADSNFTFDLRILTKTIDKNLVELEKMPLYEPFEKKLTK
ncbi:MAG: hypothetical protein INQ03_24885 [Candidatus Heimdallarchaeota archaeon]|nr:hypothetical protein [Candidatus Heimdallarchaeota archaeon]